MQFLSEPSGGSDVAGVLTTAVRDGEEWILNGSKVWTTGAWWSDWCLCLARTNWDVQQAPGPHGVHAPDRPEGHRDAPHRDAERLEGVLPGVHDRRAGAGQRPRRRRRRRLDGRHPVDVPRAHAQQLAVRDHPGRRRPGRRHRGIGARHRPGGRTRRRPRRAGARGRGADARARRPEPPAPHRRRHGVGSHVRPGRRHRPAVHRGHHGAEQLDRVRAGRGVGGGVDRRRRHAGRPRRRLPAPPGLLHRRRHHRDGPQRRQRAGARHAPRADPRPRRPVPRRARAARRRERRLAGTGADPSSRTIRRHLRRHSQ